VLVRLFLFILLGLLFSAPGEVLNQILARHDVRAFRTTLFSYSILLFLGFLAARLLDWIISRRWAAVLVHYLLFGTLGLAVEWVLLGNAPVLDPFQIVTQPGMFTYWGTMMLAPRMILEPVGTPGLRRNFVRFFAAFSAAYLLVAWLLPRDRGGIFLGFVIFAAGTAALNYFYVKYFRRLAAIDGRGKAGAGAGPS
jgi:hypothetical protein